MPGPETATVPPDSILGASSAVPRRTKLVPILPILMMKSFVAAKSWTTPSA